MAKATGPEFNPREGSGGGVGARLAKRAKKVPTFVWVLVGLLVIATIYGAATAA